jgi:8-oxo-dGTP diphosphatase
VSTEALASVFGARRPRGAGVELHLLLWQRARDPERGSWALAGGEIGPDETVDTSMARQLAQKVDLANVAHLEQLGVFSDPRRMPGRRVIAVGFLGLVPLGTDPRLPDDTRWHRVDDLPPMAFDHREIALRGLQRLRAKLSYTNIGFALAPTEFTVTELRRVYAAALGHDVDATNLQRVLGRRGMLVSTGRTAASTAAGGRPGALYRFAVDELRVTDPFAAFRPPSS